MKIEYKQIKKCKKCGEIHIHTNKGVETTEPNTFCLIHDFENMSLKEYESYGALFSPAFTSISTSASIFQNALTQAQITTMLQLLPQGPVPQFGSLLSQNPVQFTTPQFTAPTPKHDTFWDSFGYSNPIIKSNPLAVITAS